MKICIVTSNSNLEAFENEIKEMETFIKDTNNEVDTYTYNKEDDFKKIFRELIDLSEDGYKFIILGDMPLKRKLESTELCEIISMQYYLQECLKDCPLCLIYGSSVKKKTFDRWNNSYKETCAVYIDHRGRLC